VLASTSAIPRYFLATNIAQFSVDAVNGTITMAQILDYETDGRTYIFTVGAVDTSMTNTALTTVTAAYHLLMLMCCHVGDYQLAGC